MEVKVNVIKEFRCPKCNCVLEMPNEAKVRKVKSGRSGPRGKRQPWTPEEIDMIKTWHGPIEELAQKLGRKYSAVWAKYNKVRSF